MAFFDRILSYLILAYIAILPIFPSKYSFIGIPFNGDIILAVIICFYLFNVVVNKAVRERLIVCIKNLFKDIVGLVAAVLFIVMILSVIYALNRNIAIGESVRFATYIALYFIIKLEIRKKAIKKTLIGFMIVAVVVSIVGIIGIPFGFGIESQSSSAGEFVRIESTLENSNNLGAFLILIIFPFISITVNEKNKKSKILLIISTLLVITALTLTQSRNAMIALAFGCVCYIIMYNWKLISIFIMAFVGMLFVPQFRDRVIQISDTSQNSSRIKLWEIAVKMIKDHPIFGVGNGNYVSYYNEYSLKFTDIEYYARGQFHPHNIILKVQCELGILGTLTFVTLIFSIFLKLKKVVKNATDKFCENFYKGFIISFLAFIAMNIIDNFFSAPKVIAFFWITVALAEAIINDSDIEASK